MSAEGFHPHLTKQSDQTWSLGSLTGQWYIGPIGARTAVETEERSLITLRLVLLSRQFPGGQLGWLPPLLAGSPHCWGHRTALNRT